MHTGRLMKLRITITLYVFLQCQIMPQYNIEDTNNAFQKKLPIGIS